MKNYVLQPQSIVPSYFFSVKSGNSLILECAGKKESRVKFFSFTVLSNCESKVKCIDLVFHCDFICKLLCQNF